MFQFFGAVGAFVTTIVNFVVNMFSLMIEILTSMVRAVTGLSACLAFPPPSLVGFVVAPLSTPILLPVLHQGS